LDTFLPQAAEGMAVRNRDTKKVLAARRVFDCLNRHGITHVFNSWNAMPPVNEQMALAEAGQIPNWLRPVFFSSQAEIPTR
jgi:hypothetical protein